MCIHRIVIIKRTLTCCILTSLHGLHWYQADFKCYRPSKVPDPRRAGMGIHRIGTIKGCLHVYIFSNLSDLHWYHVDFIWCCPSKGQDPQCRYGFTLHRNGKRTPTWVSLKQSIRSALISRHILMVFAPETTGSTAIRDYYIRHCDIENAPTCVQINQFIWFALLPCRRYIVSPFERTRYTANRYAYTSCHWVKHKTLHLYR